LERYMNEVEALRAENQALREGLAAASDQREMPSQGGLADAFTEAYRLAEEVRGETDEEYLRRHCRELAQELYGFLNEQGYSRSENHEDPRIIRRDAEALALPQFRENLRPRARNLLKKLKKHNLYPPEDLAGFQQRSIENTLSLWGVERLADVLSEIGHDW
jgi:hypothetical protein